MLTGQIRNEIDKFWETFWTGGITNPLTVIEQITYLLFIKRLDEVQTSPLVAVVCLFKTDSRSIKGVFNSGIISNQKLNLHADDMD